MRFNVEYPARIESDVFGPVAEHLKQLFLIQFVTDNEFDIATEVMAAKANLLIDIQGAEDTSYEILIENNEIVEAYEALSAGATDDDTEATTPEAIELQQEQHELMEGDVTTVGE